MPDLDHLPGRTLLLDGREYLYCSGTGYLGMARNPAFAALLAEGLARYGSNYGASRHGNLRLRVYEEAEQHLAAYTGAEAALTVSSGYLAGQMAVRALAGAGRFAYAPGTHPAAWLAEHPATDDTAAPPSSHAAWAADLLQRLHAGPPAPTVIVTNSLDPLRVERYDFGWTRQLPTDRTLTLLVDDSHGFGVTGPDGAGIFAELPVPANVRLVVVSSLAKAGGVPGGVVLSDAAFIEQLRQSAFFGASSPVVPAYLYALLRAPDVYRQARAVLLRNVARFSAATQALGLFQSAPDFPVFFTPHAALCEFLHERGVLISSFPYPTPTSAHITRVVLSALHTGEDVDRVAALCREFAQQLRP